MKKTWILVPMLAAMACGSSGEKGALLARIDGKAFTEGDLDLRLSHLDDARRLEILGDPEQKRREFETILQSRLFALAGLESKHAKSAPLRRRLALMDQRVVTQYYFETYLHAHGGHTRRQVEDFYRARPARFTDDSGRVLPFERVVARVADSLILSKANLDSLYQATRQAYVRNAYVEASLIQTGTREQAVAAHNALRGGMSFGDAAARFSTHASRSSGGSIGRVRQGEFQYDIGSQAVADSLFFNETTRLGPGQFSAPIAKGDGSFLILAVDQYEPRSVQPFEEVRPRVAAEYLATHRTRLGERAVEALKEKHRVRLVSLVKEPTEKEIREYYEQNRFSYESPETYELYHIEASDEAPLRAALANAGSLEQFRSLAARLSDNPLTKAREGHLGVVKRDFSLPYGVGMMPTLFPLLDEMDGGKVPEPLLNPSTQKWHAFWLVRKEPPALKSLDRVRALVREDLQTNRIADVRPRDSLAVIGATGKVIREEDVLFLREEIPPQMQERYTRESLVDYLIIWQIAHDEALSLGLDRERRLRAMRLQNEDGFWGRVYQDSVLSQTWGEKPALLAQTFRTERALFTQDAESADWEHHARDIAARLRLTPRDFEIEYHTYPERYTRDSVRIPFEEARPAMFQNLKHVAYARLDEAVLNQLKSRFKVRIESPALREPPLDPATAYRRAQDLHYERRLDQALALYEKLRAAFPARSGLQDSVSFGIAQIYLEQERYPQALAEYRRVSYLNPNGPNDYKAMFMVGFVQAEHLKQDSAAIQSFEAMLRKHPNSDLSDDADWMIRNIRSGGQLMPSLEEDAETPEPGRD